MCIPKHCFLCPITRAATGTEHNLSNLPLERGSSNATLPRHNHWESEFPQTHADIITRLSATDRPADAGWWLVGPGRDGFCFDDFFMLGILRALASRTWRTWWVAIDIDWHSTRQSTSVWSVVIVVPVNWVALFVQHLCSCSQSSQVSQASLDGVRKFLRKVCWDDWDVLCADVWQVSRNRSVDILQRMFSL